jgi:hypothetical protein
MLEIQAVGQLPMKVLVFVRYEALYSYPFYQAGPPRTSLGWG